MERVSKVPEGWVEMDWNAARSLLGPIATGLHHLPFWGSKSLCKALVCCSVTKLCLTLCDPMDCGLPDSSIHGIHQARVLEWVAISYSRGSSWSWDWTRVSCIGRLILYHWAPRKPSVRWYTPTELQKACPWPYIQSMLLPYIQVWL